MRAWESSGCRETVEALACRCQWLAASRPRRFALAASTSEPRIKRKSVQFAAAGSWPRSCMLNRFVPYLLSEATMIDAAELKRLDQLIHQLGPGGSGIGQRKRFENIAARDRSRFSPIFFSDSGASGSGMLLDASPLPSMPSMPRSSLRRQLAPCAPRATEAYRRQAACRPATARAIQFGQHA